MSCIDAMLLLINSIGAEDTNNYVDFRGIFPECGYSHTIRFHEIPDRLVTLVKAGFHANYILTACDSTSSSKRFRMQ